MHGMQVSPIAPLEEQGISQRPTKVAIYARVSAAENKENLEGQAKRLQDDCAAKGYPVASVVKEIGCGVNDARPKRLKLLHDPDVTRIVVEHKDRLTRFGDNDIEQLGSRGSIWLRTAKKIGYRISFAV